MNRSTTPSLKAAMTRTILWFVAAFVAGAVCLVEHFQAWQGEAAASGAAVVVAEVLASQIDPTASPENAEQLCNRAIKHPCVLATWLLDRDDRIVASATRYPDLDAPGCVSADPAAATSRSTRVFVPERTGRPSCDATLVDVPLAAVGQRPSRQLANAPVAAATAVWRPDACHRLRALVQFDPASAPWYVRLWQWIWPMLLIGALGSTLAVWQLQRMVLAPLTQLNNLARESGQNRLALDARTGQGSVLRGAPPDVDVSRIHHLPHEVRDLAHAVLALRSDREEWRARAQQAARTVDAHVAQRTQAIHSELKRAQREIWTDPLTRLANRRVMQDRFAAIFEAQRDAGQDLTVVMLDIDHFKLLNDRLGHPCGDDLLKFTAELLRGTLRANDLAIRFGGDEFTLVLPSVDLADATAIAQRLCALFNQRTRLLPLDQPPSLSAGVASLCSHAAATADELLAQADGALYDAKAAGRNAVRAFRETVRPSESKQPSQRSTPAVREPARTASTLGQFARPGVPGLRPSAVT